MAQTDVDLSPESDAFAAIADDLLAAVERGDGGEWIMPWAGFAKRPTNPFSGRAFSGSNALLLAARTRKIGLTSPYWASPEAWMRAGGRLKDPQAAAAVFMPVFDWTRKTPYRRAQGPIGADPDDPRGNPLVGFRRHVVVNQDGIAGADVPRWAPPQPFEVLEQAQRLVDGYLANGGPALVHGGASCHYSPKYDRIHMAPRESFQPLSGLDANQSYYGVLIHEMVHSTASKNRLRRSVDNRRDSPAYAREELVAEIGSCFIGGAIGLAPGLRTSHVQYIRMWLAGLKRSRKSFFFAVRQATEAARFVLRQAGMTPPDEPNGTLA